MNMLCNSHMYYCYAIPVNCVSLIDRKRYITELALLSAYLNFAQKLNFLLQRIYHIFYNKSLKNTMVTTLTFVTVHFISIVLYN